MTQPPADLATRKQRPRWPFWLLAVLIVAIAVGLVVRMKRTAPPVPKAEPQLRRWVVSTVAADPKTLTPTLPVFGTVTVPLGARLSAEVAATVQSIEALPGANVAKGQRLIQLDDAELRLQLATRQAQRQNAEAQLNAERARAASDRQALKHEKKLQRLAKQAVERQQKLRRRDLGAQSRLDESERALAQTNLSLTSRQLLVNQAASRLAQLQAAVDQAAAAVALAELDISRSQITAPFSGRVQAVATSVGQRVQPGAPLLSMFATGQLEIRVQLTANKLAQLQAAGQREIRAMGVRNGQVVEAVLDRIGSEVLAGSGVADAYLRVVSGGDQLPPGAIIELDITLPAVTGVVAVPREALYGNNRAYLMEDGRMKSISVERAGEQRQKDGNLWPLLRSTAFGQGAAELIVTQVPSAADGLAVQLPVTEPIPKPIAKPLSKPTSKPVDSGANRTGKNP